MTFLVNFDFTANGVVIAALVATLLAFYTKRRVSLPPGIKPLSAMPSPLGANFVLGHLLLIDGDKSHLQFTKWANELGGIFWLRLVNQPLIILSDPKLFLPLVEAGDETLPKSVIYSDFNDIGDIGENAGIFSMLDHSAPKFKAIRKELALAFSMKQMKDVAMPSLMSTGSKLASRWSESHGISIEVFHDIDLSILDHILITTFNMNLSEERKTEFLSSLSPALADLSLRLTNPLHKKLVYHLMPFLPSSKKVFDAMRGCHKMWQLVYDSIKAGAPYQITDQSFAACLWRIEDAHGFTPTDVISNISVMLIAGFETSSGALAWVLYDIASNPTVAEKLYSELKSAGLIHSPSSKGRPITWEDLSLPYLNAVIKESFRMHPVAATGTHRVTTKDSTIIGGYSVPKGTMVAIEPGVFQNSIHNWEEPLSFKPDRWLQGGTGLANPAFLPFLAGPRNCLGQNMAYVTVRVVLLELLSRLKFDVDPRMGSKEEVNSNQVLALTLKHKGGIHLIPNRHV